MDLSSPIATNMIVSENRKRFSPPIHADTLGDFFSPIAAMWHLNIVLRLHLIAAIRLFEKSCNKIAHTDWLTLLAIRSDERRK